VALAIISMSLSLLLLLSATQFGGWKAAVNKVLWFLLVGVFVWMAIIWRRLH